MRAYILIEARAGMSAGVKRALQKSFYPQASLLSIDVVAGSFDLVALVEAKDIDDLGRAVAGSVQGVDGVVRTMTCLALPG